LLCLTYSETIMLVLCIFKILRIFKVGGLLSSVHHQPLVYCYVKCKHGDTVDL